MENDAAPPRKPLSAKVTNGTVGGVAVGLVTWALTWFVPAWQSAIPGPLQALIPTVLGAAGYYITGFSTKHQATTDEIVRAIRSGEVVLAEVEKAIHPMIEAAPAAPGDPVMRTGRIRRPGSAP